MATLLKIYLLMQIVGTAVPVLIVAACVVAAAVLTLRGHK